MESYLILYVAVDGTHEEGVDGWDRESAVQPFRLQHAGQRIHVLAVERVDCPDYAVA